MFRLFVLAAILAPNLAYARDPWVNPGTMGANALPALAAEQPWTVAETQLWIGAAVQQGRRNDTSFTPTFRLALPIGRYVTAYFDGAPAELWWSSPETRAEWGVTQTQGVSKADIRFGAKLLLFDGAAKKAPSAALRFMTKTTTGKDYELRRFTNAPGYYIEGIAGYKWTPSALLSVTLFGSAGFFAWQQGSSAQNDATTGSIAVLAGVSDWLTVQLEGRGYAGWQRDDKVLVGALRVTAQATSWLSVALGGNLGFLSAPRIEGRLDLIFRLPAILPLILNDD